MGSIEFHRHAEKSEMVVILRSDDFLLHLAPLFASREAAKVPSHRQAIPMAMSTWISSRPFLKAAILSCHSNGQVESRRERGTVC